MTRSCPVAPDDAALIVQPRQNIFESRSLANRSKVARVGSEDRQFPTPQLPTANRIPAGAPGERRGDSPGDGRLTPFVRTASFGIWELRSWELTRGPPGSCLHSCPRRENPT